MNTAYDAVVVGTGISGIGVAALLAKAGKKVLALEKNEYIGGRAASFSFRGFTLNIGQHAGLSGQKLDQLFEHAGCRPGAREYFGDIVIYKRGDYLPLMSLVPVGDPQLLNLLIEVQQITPKEMEPLDSVSARDWLAPRITDPDVANLLRLAGCIFTTIPWIEHMAASSFIQTLQTLFKTTDTWLPSHGMGEYLGTLVDAGRRMGAEFVTGAAVRKILVEDNRVCGVLVERGKEHIEGDLGEPSRIETPLVVASFPIWDLFGLLDASLFPEAFVAMVRHLDKRTANVGITAALREPLYEDKKFIIHEFPRVGYPGTIFMPTNIVPTIAEHGGHLLESSIICEYDSFRDREKLFRTVELMKQDLDDLFPGWQEQVLWLKPYLHWEEPARTPGREGIFRPGPKAPGIEGLYFAGDSVNSRSLSGMECAADSAMICVEEILGRIP